MLELDFDDVATAAKMPAREVMEQLEAATMRQVAPQVETAPVEEKRLLGVYPGMPEKEYRHAPGMNKSGMDNFMRSPLHYLTMKKDPPPPTPQMFV